MQGVIDDNVSVKRMLSISRRGRRFCLDLQRVFQFAPSIFLIKRGFGGYW